MSSLKNFNTFLFYFFQLKINFAISKNGILASPYYRFTSMFPKCKRWIWHPNSQVVGVGSKFTSIIWNHSHNRLRTEFRTCKTENFEQVLTRFPVIGVHERPLSGFPVMFFFVVISATILLLFQNVIIIVIILRFQPCSTSAANMSFFAGIPVAPPIEVFHMNKLFMDETSPDKVNLTIGGGCVCKAN